MSIRVRHVIASDEEQREVTRSEEERARSLEFISTVIEFFKQSDNSETNDFPNMTYGTKYISF